MATANDDGFETKYNTTSGKLELVSKTGNAEIRKIIIEGVSGSTSQNADMRGFHFIGLNGTINYQSGDRRSVMSVTTTFNTSQYPASPLVTPNNWIDGNETRYSYDGNYNSLYLLGAQSVDATKNFTFTLTGGSYPLATDFIGIRVFWDRPDFSDDGEEGTYNLKIEDQYGVQHILLSPLVFSESASFSNTQYVYLNISGSFTYPSTLGSKPIYDIGVADGKINIKEELVLSGDGIKFSDNTTLTTAPQGFSGNYNDLTNQPTLFDGNYNSLTNQPTLFDGNYNSLTNQPSLFSGNYTDLTNKPTIQTLLTDNGDDINDVACIYFTDPLAFIKGDKLTLRGITSSSGGTTTLTETETFASASGGTNAIMTGFNTNLFTNGSVGSGNAIQFSTDGTGQIDGITGSTFSQILSSGTGSGSTGNFNSLTSTGFSKFFVTKGDAPRHLRTKNISNILANCSNLSFKYCVGTNYNGGNRPESGENFYIEFLNQYGNPISSVTIWNGQSSWPNGTNFVTFSHTLTSQQQGCHFVRWYQNLTSTGNYDHYAVTGIVFTYTATSVGTSDIDIRLENLPTSIPPESNRLYKDANGFLKIT